MWCHLKGLLVIIELGEACHPSEQQQVGDKWCVNQCQVPAPGAASSVIEHLISEDAEGPRHR